MSVTTRPMAVFDLDGTLADTAGDLISTLNVVLADEGIGALPLETARGLIGAGARALIGRGFATAGRPLAEDRLEDLFRRFLEVYETRLSQTSRLYPGVIQALDRLADEGWRFAVCTNKVERHSVMLLDALGVSGRFEAICGRDTFAFHKPDPRHLTETIAQAGGASRAVMVGDSRTDIDTAKAAGIPVVAVTFGYTDVPVATLSPDVTIDHYDDLPRVIAEIDGAAKAAQVS